MVNQLHYEMALFSNQKLFEHGERMGKLLAYLVHSEDRPPFVISLHDDGGEQITDPARVIAKFWDFFAEL